MNYEIKLKSNLWEKGKISFIEENDEIVVTNKESVPIEIKYKETIKLNKLNFKTLKIKFNGNITKAGAYLEINNLMKIPINTESTITIKPPVELNIKMIVSAESKIQFKDIFLEITCENERMVNTISEDKDVLVIVPAYPSYDNLYSCAFAHSRNKEYVRQGLKVQVAVIGEQYWFNSKYTLDEVPIFNGSYGDLKELLSRHQYKVIITHFVDEKLYQIFDRICERFRKINIYNAWTRNSF